jgi:hypothetical protein
MTAECPRSGTDCGEKVFGPGLSTGAFILALGRRGVSWAEPDEGLALAVFVVH